MRWRVSRTPPVKPCVGGSGIGWSLIWQNWPRLRSARPATRAVDIGATNFFLAKTTKNLWKGVAHCRSYVVPTGSLLFTRATSVTFLLRLCETPNKWPYRNTTNNWIITILISWLNFNQFANNDDFAPLLTQLNKLSRELSTESVDTFLSTSGPT